MSIVIALLLVVSQDGSAVPLLSFQTHSIYLR